MASNVSADASAGDADHRAVSLALPLADRGRILLTFQWVRDRYGHRVDWVDGTGAVHALLVSNEGSAREAWPDSPPLQQLQVETRSAADEVALLVGMAGASHWSLSVERDERYSSFVFDAACRASAAPQWLGSRYLASSAPQHLDAFRATWQVENRVFLEVSADTSAAASSQLSGLLLTGGYRMDVHPLGQSPVAWPATVRWRYRLSVRLNARPGA